MVYRVGNMLLQRKQELFRGKVNDVVICQDMAAVSRSFYTVMVIRDHNTARLLLEIYENAGSQARSTYVNGYSWRDCCLMIFPYQPERLLDQFFSVSVRTVEEQEQVCANIVMECLGSGIPYPVQYLQLVQNQIHIQQDGSIYLGYNLDLEELTALKTEKDCAGLCARKLFLLLEQAGANQTTSYSLLELKNQREGYNRFLDLYRDIQAAMLTVEKTGIMARIKGFFRRYGDRLFRLLLTVCITLAAIALLMILCQMIFGEIPIFRLFVNSFKKIGTESLLK